MRQTGIWFHHCGYIGASPDGLIGDDALIEIKCPYKFRNADLNEVLKYEKNYIVVFNSEKDGYEINKTHNYYHQIQGLLHITNRNLCYLGIWTPQNMVVFQILTDDEWESNIQVLRNFYINVFLEKLCYLN